VYSPVDNPVRRRILCVFTMKTREERNAYFSVRHAVIVGKVLRWPCHCGSTEVFPVIKDLSRPRETVVWLCRLHRPTTSRKYCFKPFETKCHTCGCKLMRKGLGGRGHATCHDCRYEANRVRSRERWRRLRAKNASQDSLEKQEWLATTRSFHK
jgi:hypothetical protein